MDIDQLLTTTRSARKTLDLEAPVDLAVVRECLRIGLQSANGSNNQSWRWLVVADPEVRAEVAAQYRAAYESQTKGRYFSDKVSNDNPAGRMTTSTEWLVNHLAEVPLFVIPCYEPYMRRSEGDESFQLATTYGSIFPPVWNFQLALYSRGYGTCITTLHLLREAQVRDILGIPESYTQGCLLPVARLKPGTVFKPAPRKPIDEVVAVDRWDGRPL
ncbi:MAG TPA: nitroreductase family protein [Acidimicrobiales bacterium]